jgi:hypothetical protein
MTGTVARWRPGGVGASQTEQEVGREAKFRDQRPDLLRGAATCADQALEPACLARFASIRSGTYHQECLNHV